MGGPIWPYHQPCVIHLAFGQNDHNSARIVPFHFVISVIQSRLTSHHYDVRGRGARADIRFQSIGQPMRQRIVANANMPFGCPQSFSPQSLVKGGFLVFLADFSAIFQPLRMAAIAAAITLVPVPAISIFHQAAPVAFLAIHNRSMNFNFISSMSTTIRSIPNEHPEDLLLLIPFFVFAMLTMPSHKRSVAWVGKRGSFRDGGE
jgi:hypothetical protein